MAYWLTILPAAAYRIFLSPLLHGLSLVPAGCRFVPTCSRYGQEALRQYGLMVGLVFLLKRLGRCHPWSAGGYDSVPPAAGAKRLWLKQARAPASD